MKGQVNVTVLIITHPEMPTLVTLKMAACVGAGPHGLKQNNSVPVGLAPLWGTADAEIKPPLPPYQFSLFLNKFCY